MIYFAITFCSLQKNTLFGLMWWFIPHRFLETKSASYTVELPSLNLRILISELFCKRAIKLETAGLAQT
ncbi:hypothetical protein RO3G_01522 [Rhizopus delemar RA 99-880]|uniref:Uncharacterized protein n=1 Tax=Rhizopus delemar (strain RA 99-880 / ATCC MYA-4621 / FGSC 9543 / NRRL 43880) TaxID=246409 RepID=I1BKT8_RHIO9|nr:hypothetical protein RO3G_01522 [Rhizopus delemar RA 99-880]|eukprot:EIE76818.1 hypothetical protein RO3G_01522 [Rhizopus delemar RA 99-880]